MTRTSGGPGRSGASAVAPPAGLAARDVAVATLAAILDRSVPLEEAFDGALESQSGHRADEHTDRAPGLADRDRAFARLLTLTVLRRLAEIDGHLLARLEKGWPKQAPRFRQILRAAVAQLVFLEVPAHAAIDMAVRQVKRDRRAHRYDGLTNAVLRSLSSHPPKPLDAAEAGPVNTPSWLLEGWTAAYGAETARAIAAANQQPPALDLTPRDPSSAARWAGLLGADLLASGALRLAARPAVEQLPGFSDGAWWVQDAAAALPARLLGDVCGLSVADLCAAPGGKAAQLASAGALVTAVENAPRRIPRLAANLERLGLADRVRIVEADAAIWRPADPFDAVLLDAPCSATGTIRRHPDVPWIKSPAEVAALVALQGRLLDAAVEMLRPGGILVFCTCSLEPAEGVDQVEALLARRRDVERARLPDVATHWPREWFSPKGDLRTLPCHAVPLEGAPDPGKPFVSLGLDGFFAARLVRRA